MITDIDAHLKWFAGVNKRAVRDIGSLPPEAEGWKPSTGDGENAWGIGELVHHMATSRLWFTAAYCGEGWTTDIWPGPADTHELWIAALDGSAAHVQERMGGSPPEWLTRKMESLDTPGVFFSAWRPLMMMAGPDIPPPRPIDASAGASGL